MDATYGQVVSLAEIIELSVPVTNRRGEVRRRPGQVRWLRSARLKYGPNVDIMDISANGIRIRSHRDLSPNDTIVFELSTTTGSVLVVARVLWSRKIAESPHAWFETAFRFKRPLELEKHNLPSNL
jgi:PilZ domain